MSMNLLVAMSAVIRIYQGEYLFQFLRLADASKSITSIHPIKSLNVLTSKQLFKNTNLFPLRYSRSRGTSELVWLTRK